ncbi:MAG: hypothetical protein ABEI58_02875, partial [Candidatus Nanohaloarchaea archaeon]
MAKGQVINIDYAIASGVFVTGLVTAFLLSTSMFQPFDTGAANLKKEALSVSREFSDEVSWTINEHQVYYPEEAENHTFLSVMGANGSRQHAVVVNGSMEGADTYPGAVVFAVENPTGAEILSSGSGIATSNATATKTLTGSSLSNSIIDADYSSSGLESYSYDGWLLLDSLSVTDTGVDNTSKGNVSGHVDYGFQDIYFYGGDIPDLYLDSTTNSSTVTVTGTMETLEIVETGQTYDLATSTSYSGTSPMIMYNSTVGVAVAGPGIEYDISDPGSGATTIDLNGSYYVQGFSDTAGGREKALLRSGFPRTTELERTGVNRSQARDLFDLNSVSFSSKLGISASHNVTFSGMQNGAPLPLDETVISRVFIHNVLEMNG